MLLPRLARPGNRWVRWLALGVALAAAVPAAAHDAPQVPASAPRDRSVTIYRAPARNGGRLALDDLGGFAVISETRKVDLPAGEARVVFAGVADGIVPESALLSGLPGGVIEKNRDDALLSPAALMHAAVGHDVALHRVDRRTGRATDTPARIIAATDQGVIFATAAGDEALRCSGLPETFRYASGGEGLYAQPTLSVLTRSAHGVHTSVTLTYITQNFDWNANYIAQIAADGKTLHLTGWITMANGNGVTFAQARTQIVAGGLNRAYVRRFLSGPPRVIARCWPMQTTSDIAELPARHYQLVHPALDRRNTMDIIVTAQRNIAPMSPPMPVAALALAPAPPPPPPEQLGDLKLYRLPAPTTLAARQMKQTRLIDQPEVMFETGYRCDTLLAPWQAASASVPATIMLRTINDRAHHLGLPLPAGAMLVEQDQAGQVALLGEPALRDSAEGEPLRLEIGTAADITCGWRRVAMADPGRAAWFELTLANASAHRAPIELRLVLPGGWSISRTSLDAPQRDGVPTVRVTLASGETRSLAVTLAQD